MEMKARGINGVLIFKFRDIAVILNIHGIDAPSKIFVNVIIKAGKKGIKMGPFGWTVDAPVIVMIVLVEKSTREKPLFGDMSGNNRGHSLVGVILEIKELVVGIVSAKLIVQAEE